VVLTGSVLTEIAVKHAPLNPEPICVSCLGPDHVKMQLPWFDGAPLATKLANALLRKPEDLVLASAGAK